MRNQREGLDGARPVGHMKQRIEKNPQRNQTGSKSRFLQKWRHRRREQVKKEGLGKEIYSKEERTEEELFKHTNSRISADNKQTAFFFRRIYSVSSGTFRLIHLSLYKGRLHWTGCVRLTNACWHIVCCCEFSSRL